MSEDRLAGIEEKLDVLVSGQAELRVGLMGVQTRLGGVENRLTKVEISQEQMRDEIKQIAEGHGATQAAIARGVETVCAYIDRRIDPLEQVVRRR
jgi:septation ring formation regulator EzrA